MDTPFPRPAHIPAATNRRQFLFHSGAGLGALALAALCQDEVQADSLSSRPAHFPARAKNVIFMFMVGGPSPIDLFNPKPLLEKQRGKPLPSSLGRLMSQFTKGTEAILPSTRVFKRYGHSGLWMSDLMPHLAGCVDDLCYLNACWCTSTIHAPAMYELHSGRTQMGYPSLGSWALYGLGRISANLPAYCVLPQPEGVPEGGAPCWGSGFLPGVYQGTLLRPGPNPILNLKPPEGVGDAQQRRTFDLVNELNRQSLQPGDRELEARIASYELAFRMQQHAPEAVDLNGETARTRAAYGLDRKETADFGTRLLLARRLVERGVRFVQVYSGGGPLVTQWDAHDDINGNHENMCCRVDQPIAALLRDLKSRGLLEETLVVWCSEFGRTPFSQGSRGRDHNPFGYTMWLAGAGVRGGQAVGDTDEFGLHAVDRRVSVNDFHATILHLLGLQHDRLTFRHNSRDERLTDVAGTVVHEALA